MITIKKGLDVPVVGAPQQVIHDGPSIKTVATLGEEFVGMRPTMFVKVGDSVKKVRHFLKIKRILALNSQLKLQVLLKKLTVVRNAYCNQLLLKLDGDEQETFTQYPTKELNAIAREDVVTNLVNSGLWTALRTRPFSKVPAIESTPMAIFVSAMDTNPLAADPAVVIAEQSEAFVNGLTVLASFN